MEMAFENHGWEMWPNGNTFPPTGVSHPKAELDMICIGPEIAPSGF